MSSPFNLDKLCSELELVLPVRELELDLVYFSLLLREVLVYLEKRKVEVERWTVLESRILTESRSNSKRKRLHANRKPLTKTNSLPVDIK